MSFTGFTKFLVSNFIKVNWMFVIAVFSVSTRGDQGKLPSNSSLCASYS